MNNERLKNMQGSKSKVNLRNNTKPNSDITETLLKKRNYVNIDFSESKDGMLVEKLGTGNEIETYLMEIRKRISDNQKVTDTAITKLNKINFKSEKDLLNSLKCPNYGKILKNVNKTNFEERVLEIQEKISNLQTQQKVNNIMTKGEKDLLDIITETKTSLEQIKHGD